MNFKEPKPEVQAFMRENGLGFPTLLDADGGVARRYQVFGLPATFVVDRRGMLVGSVLGIRDWAGPGARAYFGRLLAMPEA